MRLLHKTLVLSFFSHIVVLAVFGLALPSRVIFFTQVPVELAPLPTVPQEVVGRSRGNPLTISARKGSGLVGIYLPQNLPKRFTGVATTEPGLSLREKNLLPSVSKEKVSLPLFLPEGDMVVFSEPSGNTTFPALRGPGAERKVIFAPLPYYPDWAKERGVEAYVELKLWIDISGTVKEVSVVKSSGFPDLDRICVETVARWRFAEEREGKTTYAILPLRFRLI